MYKKLTLLCSALLFSTSALATQIKTHNPHTIYVGYGQLTGDLSQIEKTNISFGYDYTNQNRVIFGAYYIPNLISESETAFVPGFGELTLTLVSSTLGLYSGYQFDNHIRFTYGLSMTNSDATISGSYYLNESESNIGINFGLDYAIDKFMLGGRLTTHDVGDVTGSTFAINAGFKF